MTGDDLPPGHLYLCLDQGGHASRAMVFDDHGKLVTQAHQAFRTTYPAAEQVEHDPEDLLNSLRVCLHKVIDQLGARRSQLRAAGLATQRSNIVCWDRHTGQALSPILSWQDRRAHQWLQQFHQHAEMIHKRTGLFLSPHYGASKMRWCLDNLPAVRQAHSENRLCIGPMSSFCSFHLTREQRLYADACNAARTQLWSLQTKDWDPQLLTLFGIPHNVLPRCVPNDFDYGTLQIDALTLPLRIVSGDQSAAIYAYGKLQADTAYINAGTGAFISRPSGYAKLFSRRLLTSVILQDEHDCYYVLEGTVNGAGSALHWLAEELHLKEPEHQLAEWLEQINTPLLFMNGIAGLASPYWVADFRSRFIGEGGTQEKAVGVIESIAFLLLSNVEEMQKLASPPDQIQITGGLARLDGLCQRIADLSGLPVYRPYECEASARGLAYLLARQPVTWPEGKAGIWFKPAENHGLLQRYQQWQHAMLSCMRKSA